MRTLPTSSELLEGFKRAAEAQVRGRVSATTGAPVRLSWAPTSFFNVIRVGAVRLAQRCLWVIDDRFRASFLDTAEGDDLDAWAASEAPELPRKGDAPARARVYLVRATQTTSGTIPAGTRISTVATATSPAVTFASMADVPVAVGSGRPSASPIAVDFACETTGPSGNVGGAALTRVLSPLFDTFTVAFADDAAGGDVRESDDVYRDRLRQRDARYRRGTVAAVSLGARGVPGVTRVTFSDPQSNPDIPAGSFRLIVGDARGIGSQPLADAVSYVMPDWASEGVTWEVLPAGVETVLESLAVDGAASPVPAGTAYLRFTVTRRTSSVPFDATATERAIRRALTALAEGLDHGQALHSLQVRAAVLATHPSLRNVVITARDADGVSLGTITGDWGAPIYAQNRWNIPDSAVRLVWATE